MEETGVPEENYRPVASHRQTAKLALSHNVVSSRPYSSPWTGFDMPYTICSI